MRGFWTIATAAVAALCLPAAAQAQSDRYSYPKTYYGNWKVYGIKQNCWITHEEPVNGTILSFSFAAGRPDFYYGFENRSWSNFGNMERRDVTLRFGTTERRFTGTQAVDPTLGPMMVVFVDPGVDLLDALRNAGTVGATFEGRKLFDLPLDPGAEAIADFDACSRQMKAGPYSS